MPQNPVASAFPRPAARTSSPNVLHAPPVYRPQAAASVIARKPMPVAGVVRQAVSFAPKTVASPQLNALRVSPPVINRAQRATQTLTARVPAALCAPVYRPAVITAVPAQIQRAAAPSLHPTHPRLRSPVAVANPYRPHVTGNLQMRPAGLPLVRPTQVGSAIQRYGNVIQPGFWDYAGYLTDGLSIISIVSQITAAIALTAGAASWGWLVPLALPLVASLVTDILKIEAKEQGQADALKSKEGRMASYEPSIAKFVTGVTTAVFAIAKTAVAWTGWGWVITALTAIIQIVLEIVRVRNVDRDTLYGVIKRAVESTVESCKGSCCGGERQALLA